MFFCIRYPKKVFSNIFIKIHILASDATFRASNKSDLFPATAMTMFGLPWGKRIKKF